MAKYYITVNGQKISDNASSIANLTEEYSNVFNTEFNKEETVDWFEYGPNKEPTYIFSNGDVLSITKT